MQTLIFDKIFRERMRHRSPRQHSARKECTAGEEVGVWSNGERKSAAVRASKSMPFAILICAATGSVAPLFAQNAGTLPTVNEVLERHVEATGGREALLRHKSMTVHGRYEDPAQKADYETVFYTKDGKMLLKVELGGGKQYQTGYDGETAWVLHPHGKVDIAKGDVLKTVARDADMYYHLHVLNYFKSIEVVDVKEFNGRPCYHLKGINNWDKVNEHFYDKENGLLMGYAFNTAWRGGKGDATDTFEEYKDFGGVRMAAKTTSRDGDDLTISLITAVTYDDVKDEVFALPKAVKVAVADKKGHAQ